MTGAQRSLLPVRWRFYGELDDFLERGRRGLAFDGVVDAASPVVHEIEALGVPHTEVATVLLDGEPVHLRSRVQAGQRIAVYPTLRSGWSPPIRLRPDPPQPLRFVADVHLGALASRLRRLGIDVASIADARDADIARLASREQRIVLTRDRALLMHAAVCWGGYLRALEPSEQVLEVLDRWPLDEQIDPLTRCTVCNGELRQVGRDEVIDRLPPRSAREHDRFVRCSRCGRIYWEGSHAARMLAGIAALRRGRAGARALRARLAGGA